MSTNSFLITELFVLRAVDEELAPRKVRDGAKTEELKRLEEQAKQSATAVQE